LESPISENTAAIVFVAVPSPSILRSPRVAIRFQVVPRID
jgi:hypothetical protein